MKLPDNSIGISDINAHRECPARMDFQMQRWTQEGEAPEAEGPNTAYGSAVHHAIEYVETEVASNEEAIQSAVSAFGKWLDPADTELLSKDLDTYRQRDQRWAGWRAVAVEGEYRVPMFKHNGEWFYYRFKLDRLYQNVADPTQFAHVDYKSSKWKKTQKEVDEDTQMWSYNFGIFEVFPECASLAQFYDQLRFGIVPTRKSEEQREQIRRWLIHQMKAILEDEDVEPSFNQWCPWCPLLESCPEPRRTAEFARARIAALAPEDVDTGNLVLDPDLIETYIAEAEQAGTTIKALERFRESVNAVVRDMPIAKRTYYGYELTGRENDAWTPDALRNAHAILGDDIWSVVKMGKQRVNDILKGDDRRDEVLALAVKEGQNPSVKKLPEE